ncbi:MAG: NucA/NucB deoxyribonuclease domain-containing protein [Pseudomonadota bacterium]
MYSCCYKLDTPAAPRGSGLSRDEYPPACCRECGAGSSVRVIPGRDNSSAGAQFGNQVRQLPDGTKVRIKVK